VENVIVVGNKGELSGYYRLRSIDADTGEPGALQLIKHTQDFSTLKKHTPPLADGRISRKRER
jgi:hypothetical protein